MSDNERVSPAPSPQPQTATGGGTSSATAPSRQSVQLKRAMADKDFAEQEAMLSPVQRAGAAAETDGVHAAAQQGISGSATALPHLGQIQQAFGRHDVGAVQAHTDGAAQAGSAAMGAKAYATGHHVAFGGTPDLHTAAHEAAHVVQQRGGVSLSGGVGKGGDRYEKHADAVADAVVSGKSAEPLLDTMAGGGGGPAVQGLHGDLSAQVRPEIAAENPEMAGRTVGEAGAGVSERDANFNPARKVELEVRLTAAILQNPGPALAVVHEVSRKMLAYFDAKVTAGLAQADADLRALGTLFAGTDDRPNTVFFGRLADSASQLRGDIASEMRGLLMGGGTMTQHLFAHHQFIDQIWDKGGAGDFAQNVAGQLQQIGRERGEQFNVQVEAVAPKHFRKDAGGAARPEFAERGRYTPKDRESRVGETFGQGTAVPTTGAAAGIAARQPGGGATPQGTGKQSAAPAAAAATGLTAAQGGEQAHQRGIDRLTMDESNAFIQRARLVLDMPLAGGVSGTTTDLMEVATIFGVSDLHLYALGVLGHLGSAGAHSFHEIAKAASFAGVPYRDGDYASFIPPAYLPTIAGLLREYADVLHAPAGGAAVAKGGGGAADGGGA